MVCDQRKYPEATDYAICSLIGGFFFLRFINPAIVTPQAYMLVEGVPAKHPRRTLTLVCTLLIFFSASFLNRMTDCENASKSRKQALLRQRGVYDDPESLR